MAANNAVVGARAGHPFLSAMLRSASRLPLFKAKRRYRLGTHLLQKTLKNYVPESGQQEDRMTVLSASHFYPLGPEISRHYFHAYEDPRAIAREIFSEETYAIHWYASVSDLSIRDAHYIRKTAHQSVYASLCRPHVPDWQLLPQGAPAISAA